MYELFNEHRLLFPRTQGMTDVYIQRLRQRDKSRMSTIRRTLHSLHTRSAEVTDGEDETDSCEYDKEGREMTNPLKDFTAVLEGALYGAYRRRMRPWTKVTNLLWL